MFEKAAKLKLRWTTSKGLLSSEDLWDLSLPSLDALAKSVNKQLKEEGEESFISTKTKSNTELELKLKVLKHIIEYKLSEAERRKIKAQRAEELELLNSLLNGKKVEELKSLSSEELKKKIEELQS